MSQFERIAAIDRILRERGTVTVDEVAHRFEVNRRTVGRDIEYLRDRLSAPIEWDAASRSYRYGAPFDSLRFADERALIAYALLRGLLLTAHYIPLFSSELLEEVERRVPRDYLKVAERIGYELPVSESVDLENFTIVAQAMVRSLRVDLRYRNAKGEASERTVECERLVNYSGRWYLIAHDLLRGELRTFHLSRVEHAALSRDRIERDSERESRVAAYLGSSFGIFKGGAVTEVAVRIRGAAAPLVARQTWHPSQRLSCSTDADGTPVTDLRLPVADWTELLGRVLSFGSAAEPLEPPAFRAAWRAEIARMAERAAEP